MAYSSLLIVVLVISTAGDADFQASSNLSECSTGGKIASDRLAISPHWLQLSASRYVTPSIAGARQTAGEKKPRSARFLAGGW